MSPVNAQHRSRAGFTLAELLVSVVLLTLVGTAIMSMIIRQQRFYVGTSEIIETRSSVRQIADLLPTELRALSPANGDIDSMGIAGIKFRSIRGATVICNLMSSTQIVVPPANLSRRNGLTSWAAAPQPGDSIMVFDIEANPREWRRDRIAAVAPGAGLCLSTLDFTATAAENTTGTRIMLESGLPATVINGAAVRIYRQASYELYRAGDQQWYLGYRDCLPTRVPACDAIQPVSGPYLPRGMADVSGLAFRYIDATNSETAIPENVVRIDVVARSRSQRAIRHLDGPANVYQDSVAFSIAVRN